MASTLRASSLPKSLPPTPTSSCMTSQSAMRSQEASGVSCLTHHPDSNTSTMPSSQLTASRLRADQECGGNLEVPRNTASLPSATASILQLAATQMTASINTSAGSVEQVAMLVTSATSAGSSKLAHGAIPCYLRYNVWTNEQLSSLPSTTEWSETAEPLPSVPPHELNNPIAQKTISENLHLFSITTPINVDVFEKLLASHPNQPFVRSVCRGLHEGFWPWADTHIGE